MLVGSGKSMRPITEPVTMVSSWALKLGPKKNSAQSKTPGQQSLNLFSSDPPKCYKCLNANFIISSTDADGECFKTASQAFSAILRAYPKVSNADND